MPKPFPSPPADAHYVGESTVFFPVKDAGEGVCDWCDQTRKLTTLDANDGIFVQICRACEYTARGYSHGGFRLQRKLVQVVQEVRAKQVAAQRTQP